VKVKRVSPKRWLAPILDLERVARGLSGYAQYLRDWRSYSRLPGAEDLSLRNAYPCLHDRLPSTPVDAHYFYQDWWASSRIVDSKAETHVDVGSLVSFVGLLAASVKVMFVDVRPLVVHLPNLHPVQGDILALPFGTGAIRSISCLHVAEHIGLGRYGDNLNPAGTRQACAELARVLAPGGNLYFSVPVGVPRICFNAHRVHSPEQILEYLRDLSLADFACVDDRGVLHAHAQTVDFGRADYACGLFHLTKEP
jgi:SAM-dependent methyltransferase